MQGLYRAGDEHDACGVGFVASIKGARSHSIVRSALELLINLEHRGACGSDPDTGDVLTITLERRILIYKVLDAGVRRGPAEEARKLYEDMSPPPAAKGEAPADAIAPLRETGSGRPTKRERSETDRLRGRE